MLTLRPKPLVLALTSALSTCAIGLPAQAATVTWTGGGANAKWKTASNWDSSPALPGATDDVVIGAVATVLHDNTAPAASTIRSLTSQANQFNITGGTLVINGASFLNQLTQSGGLLDGTGAVSVAQAQITGGGFAGSGVLELAAGGNHAFGGGGLNLDGGRVLRNAGTATFDSGASVNWTGNLNTGLSQSGSGRFENTGTLNLVTYLNRAISFAASNNGALDNGSDASFDNSGTVKKIGDGSVTMGVRMNNRGTLNVAAGYNAYGINFYGGLLDQQNGGLLTGTGGVLLRSNDVFRAGSKTNIENIYVWGNTTIEDGARFNPKNLRIRGGYSVSKTGVDSLVWNTQTLVADGSLNVAQNAPLILARGRLAGAGTVAMQNAAGATTPALVVKTGATLAPGATYDNNTDWTGGTLSVTGGLLLEAGSNFEVDLFYAGGYLTNPTVTQDKLVVSGEATLAGQLIVELNPQLEARNLQGRSFVILTSQRLYGQFDHIAGLGSWGNYGYAVEYFDSGDADSFADSVRISFNAIPVAAPVPEPENYALMLAGLGLLVLTARHRAG